MPLPKDGVLTLTSTNMKANEVNDCKLASLSGKEYTYEASSTGDFKQIQKALDKLLRLKIGAQIMMLRNDRQQRWTNGTLGVIEELAEDEIKVNIEGKIHSVERVKWQALEHTFDEESGGISKNIVGEITQFPLCLAWAVTIHKSQGQTYKTIAIDFGRGAFAHGQAYVALSRCQSLDGLYLLSPLKSSDVILDERIVEFFAEHKVPIMKPNYIPSMKPISTITNTKELEFQFHADMEQSCRIIKEHGYNPKIFDSMIKNIGGFKTAKRLIRSEPSQGFNILASMGLLIYSMEALVIKPEYQPLFTERERDICQRLLESHGYIN
jgi:hypothetical protein